MMLCITSLPPSSDLCSELFRRSQSLMVMYFKMITTMMTTPISAMLTPVATPMIWPTSETH